MQCFEKKKKNTSAASSRDDGAKFANVSVSGATYDIIGLLITNKRNSDAMQEEIDLFAFCTKH